MRQEKEKKDHRVIKTPTKEMVKSVSKDSDLQVEKGSVDED